MYTVWGTHQIISLRLCDAQSGQEKLLVAHSSKNFYSVVPHDQNHTKTTKVTSAQAEKKFSFLPQKVTAAI